MRIERHKDMVYLARLGYRVVGVDGVRKAIEDFAKDCGCCSMVWLENRQGLFCCRSAHVVDGGATTVQCSSVVAWPAIGCMGDINATAPAAGLSGLWAEGADGKRHSPRKVCVEWQKEGENRSCTSTC